VFFIKQVIYADIIFLLNFCMDFLALFAAGKILGLKLSAVRLVLSSVLGAVYCIFTFLYDYSVVPEMIINIFISVIMCFIAYNINSLIKFTKIFVIFYAACFMLGGGIEALYYLSGLVKTEDIIGGPDLNASLSFQTVIIFAGLCTLIIVFAGTLFKRRFGIKDTEITIGFMGKEVKVDTIVDSGNLLYEPISSLPVIVVTLQSAANLFDMDTIEFFAGDSVEYLNKITGNNIGSALKFRIVPIKSVMDSKAILPAFSPEYIKYKAKTNKFGRDGKYTNINAIIAVDNKNTAAYGEKYGGIIPAILIDT